MIRWLRFMPVVFVLVMLFTLPPAQIVQGEVLHATTTAPAVGGAVVVSTVEPAPGQHLVPAVPRPLDTPVGLCANATNDATFNQDFSVSFSPDQINMVGNPIVNVSQFANRVSLTLSVTPGAQSAGVSIVQALLTVWGVPWNRSSNFSSTSPNSPAIWNLPIANGTQATGILIDQKYFPPGSLVFFNLTVEVAPSYQSIASPCPIGADPTWSQVHAQPTWEYEVSGGWPSSSFLSDIQLNAFPNIFVGVFPDPFQPVHLSMNSIAGAGTPIGGANIYYNVTYTSILTGNSSTSSGGQTFHPANSTSASVSVGPYWSNGNKTEITFYILAWELWSGGAVNYIKSPSYRYAVTNGGTWCNANQSFASYVSLTTSPESNITTQNNTQIPAFTIVNVSVETVSANTTMAYAYVYYNETFQGKKQVGLVPMNYLNATSEYTGSGFQNPFNPSLLGPYPPGVTISFSVSAFDTLKCIVHSPTYTFHTAVGPPPIINEKTFFYVVAYDQGIGAYAVGAKVTFNNQTWWDNTSTNRLGFAFPNITGTDLPLYLSMDQYYNVSVTYAGQMQSIHYLLDANSNKTLTFYFNSQRSVPVIYALSATPFNLWLIGGLVAASVVVVPVFFVWSELRRKAEEEEKRITL